MSIIINVHYKIVQLLFAGRSYMIKNAAKVDLINEEGLIMKRRFLWLWPVIAGTVALIAMILIVWKNQVIISYNPVKAAGISAYYFLHYTSLWFGWKQLILAAGTIWVTWRFSRKTFAISRGAPYRIGIAFVFVYLCFMVAVMKIGSIGMNPSAERALQIICLLWMEGTLIELTGWLKQKCRDSKGDMKKTSKWSVWAVILLLVISCIPIIMAGRFTYPQGDDFEYGIYCHKALLENGSFAAVIKAACQAVVDGFWNWQGTFASIFIMAIHPGVWGTQYYHLVPSIMLLLLVSSSLFFWSTFLRKLCCASLEETMLVGTVITFLVVQLPISKASTFFWFNGAINYVGAFGFLLFFISFVIRALIAEKGRGWIVLGCIAAVLVGGGNLVTGLTGSILIIYIVLALWILKKQNQIKRIALPGVVLLVAYAVNVLAPGNFVRQSHSGDLHKLGVAGSIIKSFQVCLTSAMGEWTDWFWLILILGLLPVFWNVVKRIDFIFPVPALFFAASFCVLAAMYTPQLYAIGKWRTGRVLNITYFTFLILTALNELYFIGWLNKRQKVVWNHSLNRGYYTLIGGISVILCLLTAIADPEKMTVSAILRAVISGEAQEYASIIEDNIALLESSDEEIIIVQEPPRKPEVLVNEEIEAWRIGTAGYYGRKKVRYPGESMD